MMDLTKLKNQLPITVPQELYLIEPNKVFYFVAKDGFALGTAIDMMQILTELYRYGAEVQLNCFPTENEALKGLFATRLHQETGSLDKVVISEFRGLPEFAREVLDKDSFDWKTLDDYVTENGGAKNIIIIEINPKDSPIKGQNIPSHIESSYQSDFDMEYKIAKPEKGSAAERERIAKEEKILEKVLKECAVLGIELDIDRIKKKVEEDLKKTIDYKLIIKKQRNKLRPRTIEYNTYDIYVAEGEEYKLELTGSHKAVYLTYLLYKDGIRVEDTYGQFREITKRIYMSLPSSDKNEKDSGGITDKRGTTLEAHSRTLRGYITEINQAIDDIITEPLIAQDFAIGKYKKGDPYSITKTTPEVIAQIKEDFGL